MSGNDDPYLEERTERRDEEGTYDEGESRSLFPSAWAPWSGGWGAGLPYGTRGDVDEETREGRHGEEEGSWLEEGLYTLLIVAGVALFLFPEPSTSMLGVFLILFGAIGWLFDALT